MKILICLLSLYNMLPISGYSNNNSYFDEDNVIIYDSYLSKKPNLNVYISGVKTSDSILIYIYNSSADTIFIFSTIFSDIILVCNKEYTKINKKKNEIEFNFQEDLPIRYKYFSGLDEIQFIKINPNNSINLSYNIKKIKEIFNVKKSEKLLYKFKFSYYNQKYFQVKNSLGRLKYNGFSVLINKNYIQYLDCYLK